LNLKIRKKIDRGYTSIVEEEKEIELIQLGILRLERKESFYRPRSDGRETALVILGGNCDIFSGAKHFSNIGKRKSVFEGPATLLYLPADNEYKITANSSLEVAITTAPSTKQGEPVLVKPESIKIEKRGKDGFRREIHHVMIDNIDAERLIIGETFVKSGNWASYPPHKHDQDNPPEEAKLEEIYFFKVYPEQGFGIQRVYSADKSLNEVYVVENNDAVMIPRGYHPLVAAPGYILYYFWVMAGEKRVMMVKEDPQHLWMEAKV